MTDHDDPLAPFRGVLYGLGFSAALVGLAAFFYVLWSLLP